MNLCPLCGVKLKENYCPNHGLIEENKSESDNKTPSYIN